MSIRVLKIDHYILNVRTRMPFRYGIASMTAVPHLFLQATVEVDGKAQKGIAADHLPPKWFTKNPETSFRHDVMEMIDVIRFASQLATQQGESSTVFDFWQKLYAEQMKWGKQKGYPPLLSAFGVTLVERAVISAFCRSKGVPFKDAAHQNLLGMRLGDVHEELAKFQPADLLPDQPLRTIHVRHTVGLTDPLTEDDIPSDEKLRDGLPQSLDACVATYGLRYFKIKLGGNPEKDIARLKRLTSIIGKHTDQWTYTLDANEQYKQVETFKSVWETLSTDPTMHDFVRRLLFIEQPLHRDVALSPEARKALLAWKDRPSIIIDESDGELRSLVQALDCGYVGTSHKNCKGIFKGIANACLLEYKHRREEDSQKRYIMSAEDLSNIGPVALLEDLAALAVLGIDHAERNGHHYFRGLSMYAQEVQDRVLKHHADLYRRHQGGFPTLNVRQGEIQIGSVVDSPFGVAFDFDPTRYTPLNEWKFESLES